MAQLRLSLLGPFRVWLDGQAVQHFDTVKTQALLAYLAESPGRPCSRLALASLLWPTRMETAALRDLRHTLADLRDVLQDRQVQPGWLQIGHDWIALVPAVEEIDVISLRQALDAADGYAYLEAARLGYLEQAAVLYTGDFMENFLLDDCPMFTEWVQERRGKYRCCALDALFELAEASLLHGDAHRTAAFARRQIELEPWREEAHCQLMKALALAGRRSEALAQFGLCREWLARELDVEPGQVTRALFKHIRDDE